MFACRGRRLSRDSSQSLSPYRWGNRGPHTFSTIGSTARSSAETQLLRWRCLSASQFPLEMFHSQDLALDIFAAVSRVLWGGKREEEANRAMLLWLQCTIKRSPDKRCNRLELQGMTESRGKLCHLIAVNF